MLTTKNLIQSVLLCVGLCASACTSSNTDFCDESTSCTDTVVSFCNISSNTCISPPSASACNSVEPCPDDDFAFCSDNTGGQCVECLEHSQCEGDMLCDTATNACTDFRCDPGAEGDALCSEITPGLPYCAADDTCAICSESSHCTESSAPVCDDQSFTCRECTADSECESGVCREDEGRCVSESEIVYVATSGNQSVACGSREMPCQTIEAGLATADTARNTLLIAAGTYPETITIDSGTRYLIADGSGDVIVESDRFATTPVLSVSGLGTLVIVEGLSIVPVAGNTQTAVSCSVLAAITMSNVVVKNSQLSGIVSSGSLRIDGSTIIDNGTLGIWCTGGQVEITDSIISGNVVGITIDDATFNMSSSTIANNSGISMDVGNSDFTIVNNFITQNGGGVLVNNANFQGTQVFDFNTVADNLSYLDTLPRGIQCNSQSPMIAFGNIFYRVFQGNQLQPNVRLNGNCTVEYSNIEQLASLAPAPGNIEVPPQFANAQNGDYHLQSNSMCIDAIPSTASTIMVDIDGDGRPGNGRYDMGADEAN